jgi:GNAT superfamily N-acetyltransferase
LTVIRDAAAADGAQWRRLWRAYNAFYGTTLQEAVTAQTWRRILDPGSPIFARLAEREGRVVGCAVAVLHEGTWTTEPACYLEDLFVDPAARGCGVGRALIDDLLERARRRGWSRLYWHTEANNTAARHLYDKYVPADNFVRYRIILRS